MLILPRIDAPIVNRNFHFLDRRAGFDRGLTSSYPRIRVLVNALRFVRFGVTTTYTQGHYS